MTINHYIQEKKTEKMRRKCIKSTYFSNLFEQIKFNKRQKRFVYSVEIRIIYQYFSQISLVMCFPRSMKLFRVPILFLSFFRVVLLSLYELEPVAVRREGLKGLCGRVVLFRRKSESAFDSSLVTGSPLSNVALQLEHIIV